MAVLIVSRLPFTLLFIAPFCFQESSMNWIKPERLYITVHTTAKFCRAIYIPTTVSGIPSGPFFPSLHSYTLIMMHALWRAWLIHTKKVVGCPNGPRLA